VDVRDGLPTVEARMRRTTRNEIRQARRAGVTVREGGRDDLGLFFELMTATCRRQKVVPNPASEPVLRAMWDAFASQALIRLTFAEHAGTALAGALLIRFGERATLFKKGWCSTQANLRSNQLLTFELLEYIHSQGWRCLDFAGLDPSIAHALLRHQPLSPEQTRGRDFFHLGFGGQPVLLPPAVIWFRNRLVEWGFHLAVRCKQALRHGVRR
jgi:lipid II:glycine glycyltransferase (peptidoglycan interpeptide bridge formation enzyme)